MQDVALPIVLSIDVVGILTIDLVTLPSIPSFRGIDRN
jgi:hypothetical protein